MSIETDERRTHGSLGATAAVFAVILVVFTLTRIAIASRLEFTGVSAEPVGTAVAFAIGALRDVGVALFMTAPLFVLFSLARRRWSRFTVHSLVATGLVVLVFGAVAEVFFWEEFANRLNGIAVFYLMFPREVIGNLRESFDLPVLLPPIVAAGALIGWGLRRRVAEAMGPGGRRFARPRRGRRVRELRAAAAPGVAARRRRQSRARPARAQRAGEHDRGGAHR